MFVPVPPPGERLQPECSTMLFICLKREIARSRVRPWNLHNWVTDETIGPVMFELFSRLTAQYPKRGDVSPSHPMRSMAGSIPSGHTHPSKNREGWGSLIFGDPKGGPARLFFSFLATETWLRVPPFQSTTHWPKRTHD